LFKILAGCGLMVSQNLKSEANSNCQEFEKLNIQVIELNARLVDKWLAGGKSVLKIMKLSHRSKKLVVA